MTDFIIFEESWEMYTRCKMIILNFLGSREEKFKIYDYNKYENNVCNNKIYILTSSNLETNLKIAKKIRKQGDWNSQIILINENEYNNKCNRLLILDYIIKDEKLKENLKLALLTAIKIISNNKVLSFVCDGEIYNIPYKDILYIEKSNNQNHSKIYTKNASYNINDTICNLNIKLEDVSFMKTHRSCIINLNNVKAYDYLENIVYFKDREINLISKQKRTQLKERLLHKKVI